MAISKFLVVLALFFTCLSLAISEPSKPWEQTEMVNPNEETDVKEPEQNGGGYTGWCRHGCCYGGSNGCIRCCRYPNEKTNSVEIQKKRSRGGCKYGCCGSYAYGQCSACCSLSQVAEKAKEQEATPVWAQVQP